jgi:uncharacterized protein (TIGR02646 family)
LKPVDKGAYVGGLKAHGDAKPELVARLGQFCSYCESPSSPQQLHVEHIYPQANTAHPGLSKCWRNFLLACPTCNTYKNRHLGNGRQFQLLKRFLWPHIDNTFEAFKYERDGRVIPRPGLPAPVETLAQATSEMVGLLRSPAVAANYAEKGMAYDGIKMREEAWGIAERALTVYLENPSAGQLYSICDNCSKTGHFSVWMEVFRNHVDVKRALIAKCKAAPACFDPTTCSPIRRGRC